MSKEKIVPSKFNVSWPVEILAEKGTIKTKSRTITSQGLFLISDYNLPHDETFKIVVRPSENLSVLVTCELISSIGAPYYAGTSHSLFLYFAKFSYEDRNILDNLIALAKGKKMETVKKVNMRLYLETDRRTVKKHFDKLDDLRLYMHNFFSLPEVMDRRAEIPFLRYTGPERRFQT